VVVGAARRPFGEVIVSEEAGQGPGTGARPDVLARLAVLATALVALALVAMFDLQTNLPFSDEYARRWTIQHLAHGDGLSLWGTSPNLAQILASLPLAVAHLDPRFWRLPGLGFLAAQGIFSGLIARRLGATRTWIWVAAAIPVTNPLNLSLATGMMTETAFVALLLCAAWLAIRWITTGASRWTCVLISVVTVLQRQQGGLLALVVAVGLLMAWRHRRLVLADGVALGVMWVATLGAFLAGQTLHLSALNELVTRVSLPIPSPHLRGPIFAIYALASLPPMLGFVVLPLTSGLVFRPPGTKDGAKGRLGYVPLVLAELALVVSWYISLGPRRMIFPGPFFTPDGLGAQLQYGTKVSLIPFAVFVAFEILVSVSFLVVLVRRRLDWVPPRLGLQQSFLALLALSQFAVIFVEGEVHDRYFTSVAMPLVPLLASWIAVPGRRHGFTVAWASVTVIAGVAFYVAAEQDFIAWQTAADRAAQAAYEEAPPEQVDAGFEQIATHVWIPYVEDPYPGRPFDLAPKPRLRLAYARPDDLRPGVTYQSLAPGKVVIDGTP
jgi:hypothetical protein